MQKREAIIRSGGCFFCAQKGGLEGENSEFIGERSGELGELEDENGLPEIKTAEDESGGGIIKADILQRSYRQIAEQFGISKRDASNAMVALEKLGVVKRVFRKIKVDRYIIPNVMLLALDVEVLKWLTFPEGGEPGDGDRKEKDEGMDEDPEYPGSDDHGSLQCVPTIWQVTQSGACRYYEERNACET